MFAMPHSPRGAVVALPVALVTLLAAANAWTRTNHSSHVAMMSHAGVTPRIILRAIRATD
jgi:hypothetical protein